MSDAAPAWSWHADAGGEIAEEFHGIANAGVRRGPWSAELYTDTVELRWDPSGDRGRAWLALRGEGGAAGMFISPWTDGAPDPARAFAASYLGAEAGVVRYGPAGLYAGADLGWRAYRFDALKTTQIEVPEGTRVVSAEVLAGAWAPTLHVWLRAGADLAGAELAPRAALEAGWTPTGRLAPALTLRVGGAEGQGELVRTRLGGTNPYVVPLVGAAWAEFLVEDYAALRAELRGRWTAGAWSGEAGPLLDVAAFDGRQEGGLGARVRVERGRAFAEVTAGVAPWLERQEGVSRVGTCFRLGVRER